MDGAAVVNVSQASILFAPRFPVPLSIVESPSLAPWFTVKVLLVPDLDEPDVLIESVPADVSVTDPVQTPDTNAVVLVGLIVPADAVRVLVPV